MSDTNEIQQEMLEQSIDHSQTKEDKKHDEEIAPQTNLIEENPQEEQRRVRKLVGVKVSQCLLLSPFVVLIV